MKIRFLRSATVLLLVCALALSLTGCDSLDYREAIELYNAQEYEAAAEIFYALGDYEDSESLYTRCQYWIAVTMMEYGNYQEALPRFMKLGDYEDAPARVTECKYQMAVAAFEAGDHTDAQIHFQDVAEYKLSQEFLRRITWQRFFDAVAAAGTESGGSFTLQTQQEGKVFSLTADMTEPNRLIFFVSHTKDMGYTFYDDLTLTLTRDSTEAAFTASSTFSMDFKGSQIGSEQKAAGKVDITTCTVQTVPVIETFEKTVTDNQGKTTTSNDPADCLMTDDIVQNLADLLTVIPALLADSGVELTLNDIGFTAIT